MSEDWRTIIELTHEDQRTRLIDSLRGRKIAREAREKVADRVVVTHDGPRVFLYTDGEADARALEQMARALLAEHDVAGTVSVARWHPIEERWEDAAAPLPATPEQEAAERARRGETDRELSRRQGYPEWDVRLTFPTREGAVDFAERLEGEGLVVVRRAETMIAGADTEDEARALAERLRGEAPEGTRIEVEVNRAETISEAHPLAFLGGLAG